MAQKKKAPAKTAAPREMLLVQSKVKAYLKDSHEMMSAGDLLDALNDSVHELLDAAARRTKTNSRVTVRGGDV